MHIWLFQSTATSSMYSPWVIVNFRANNRDSPSGNLSESQQPLITCHLSPSGATLWPPYQSKPSNMWRWGGLWHRYIHILTVDLSDLAPLYSGTTQRFTVYSTAMYWWVSGHRGLKSHEAVLLCLALFFPVCSASDRKTAKNHGLSQLKKQNKKTVDEHEKQTWC